MKVKSTPKKNGNSLFMLIPSKFVKENNVTKGTKIIATYEIA